MINKLKKEIKLLEEEYKKFRSNCKCLFLNNLPLDNNDSSPSESDNKSTTTKDNSEVDMKIYDEDEEKLLSQEKELMNEMNEIGAKYRNVDIVYDRVIYNLKKIVAKYQNTLLVKQEKPKEIKEKVKDDEGKSIEEISLENEEKEKEKEKNKSEVLVKYEKILGASSERISKFLEGNSKETFENIVRDKFKIVEHKSKAENKQAVKLEGALSKQIPPTGKLVEYDYEDRDVKDEDRQINEHVVVLNRIYWNEVS